MSDELLPQHKKLALGKPLAAAPPAGKPPVSDKKAGDGGVRAAPKNY